MICSLRLQPWGTGDSAHLDCVGQRVANVQRAGHVGGRDHNHKRRLVCGAGWEQTKQTWVGQRLGRQVQSSNGSEPLICTQLLPLLLAAASNKPQFRHHCSPEFRSGLKKPHCCHHSYLRQGNVQQVW